VKLTDIFHVKVEETNLHLNCEVTPGHTGRVNAIVTYEKPVVVGGKVEMLKASTRACPICFAQFVYDISLIAREIHGRT
jgi:hypothetical protein